MTEDSRAGGARRVLFVLTEEWTRTVDHDEEGRPLTPRDIENIDDFVAAMRRHTDLPVDVAEADGVPRELGGVLIVGEERAAGKISAHLGRSMREVVHRMLLFNVRGPVRTMDMVESYEAVGAIESRRYWTWRVHRDDDPGGGVFGRKDVARHMGASWHSPGYWESENYCLLLPQPEHPTLPEAVAAYLTAYAETLPRALE